MHSTTFKAIALVCIMVTTGFSVMAITHTGPFDPQSLSVKVVDTRNHTLSNVSVQGLIILPTSEGGGFKTVFAGSTGKSGLYSTTNLTETRQVMTEWGRSIGSRNLSFTGPAILVFVTDVTTNGTYFAETSINLLPSAILSGESGSARAVLNLTGKPQMPYPSSSPNNTTANPATSISPPPDTSSYYWVQKQADYTGTVKIPISWVSVNSYAYGGVDSLIYSTSTTQWNVGVATGTDGVTANIGHIYGGTIWQNTSQYLNYWNTGYPGTNGYVYINAQAEGVLFQMYTWNSYDCLRFGLDCGSPTSNYQYDAGIINPAYSSSQVISGGGASGQPPYIAQINTNFSLTYYNSYTGQGSAPNSPAQYIYSTSFVNDFSHSDTTWINVGVDVGAVLVAILAPEIAIPAAVALSVVGTLSTTSTGLSLGELRFDAPTGYSIDVYVAVDNVNYQLSNGYTGQVPIMGTEVLGFPSGGGGGGCVLNGTDITLANGTTVPVQKLTPGMSTLSYDTVNDTLITSTVSKVTKTSVITIIDVNHNIGISGLGDQPVFVKLKNGTEEWKTLGELNYSMSIFNPTNKTWTPITSLTAHNGNFSVYDVVTARQFTAGHTTRVINDYIANGVLLDVKTT